MDTRPLPFLPRHPGTAWSGYRALAAAALFALSAACQAAPGEVPIGGILPEATLQGLNGPPRKLSSFRGKPLVINVWASWCGPCRQEAASLERLAWSELG
ncbi:MAG: TlpA family protein disulfide reductase, partial [Pseudomonadota bacterium]|nr:TlpA family protein disulfide reductase [Pseudomonadota bacterium]